MKQPSTTKPSIDEILNNFVFSALKKVLTMYGLDNKISNPIVRSEIYAHKPEAKQDLEALFEYVIGEDDNYDHLGYSQRLRKSRESRLKLEQRQRLAEVMGNQASEEAND